jgi:MFS family permease
VTTTVVNEFEADDAGLAATRAPRTDFLAERVEDDGSLACAEGPFDRYRRVVEAEPLGGGRHRVRETIDFDLAIPLWGGLFRPLVRRQLRRHEAPPPPVPEEEAAERAPWWSPPARLDARSAAVLSRLCGLSMLTGYLGTTITQTMTYAADEFGASKQAQGTTLALVRVGVLLSLALSAASDRRGRRKLLVLTAAGGALASALGAASPNLAVLGVTQTFARAFATALALLISVLAAEEMPAGGRAYAASVLAMTAALGAGLAVALLPLADAAPWAWRTIYLVPLAALPFFLRVGRDLPESRRMLRPHARTTMRGHRGRLLLLSAAGFFGLMFLAPVTQFQNEFLRDEHGFTALKLSLFTFATSTPAGIGIVVGGRLADVRGRRLIGAIGTVGGAVALSIGYQLSGIGLWLAWMCGTVVAAMTVPALGVYGPELFPTSLRGRANGIITLAGVAGSSVGLTVAGRLGDRWGDVGPGIALLGLGPLIVAVLVLTLYPETAHLELEAINPEDAAGAGAVAPPML